MVRVSHPPAILMELDETQALVPRYEEDEEDEDASSVDYSAQLDAVLGNGRYQWLATLTCGLGVAAGSTEVMAIALALPEIEIEFGVGEATQWQRNMVASCIFIGMLLGGLISGFTSDLKGRKSCLIFFTGFIAVFGAMTAFAKSLSQVAAFRFLAGLGIGGNIPSIFSYVAETTSSKVRGKYMTVVASNWMLGSVVTAAVGWIVLPRNLSLKFIPVEGWRLYFLISVVPSVLTCALALLFLVESPCFLIQRNKLSRAALALERIAQVNEGSKHLGKGGLLAELLATLRSRQERKEVGGDRECVALMDGLRDKASIVCGLLKQDKERKLVIVLATVWFSLSACWYGFMIWLPLFFQAKHDNVYLGNLVTSAGDLPGNIMSFLLIDRVGRKRTLLVSLAAAAMSPLAFAAAPKGSTLWAMAGSACFGFVSVGAWNALSILSPEAFDTRVRTTMHGLLTAVGRVGGFFGTYIVGHIQNRAGAGVWFPCVFASSVLGLGCLATMFVPETTGKIVTDYKLRGSGRPVGGQRIEEAGSALLA